LQESASPETSFEALPPGTSLQGGSIILDHVLGQGGFGITYLGQDTLLGAHVAVKEFFPYGCLRRGQQVQPSHILPPADFDAGRVSFLQEAQMALRFRHPNIVAVQAVFEQNNSVYLVMEYLHGATLHEVLESRGAVAEKEALFFIEQIGEALETLHAANLLHRDIKPENIMVCPAGEGGLLSGLAPRVVLLDFGSVREFSGGRTRQMTSVLTPGYAPLEQYGQRARYGRFTDIYALGATLYHLLSGQAPPQATDRAAGYQLLPPEQINPNVSHLVSDAVMWAMEMRVDERPQTVRDWVRALHLGRRAASAVAAEPEPATEEKVHPMADVLPPRTGDGGDARPATVAAAQDHWTKIIAGTSLRLGRRDWYAVSIQVRRVKWPKLCVCCNAPCTTFLPLTTTTATWEVPCCPNCRGHAEHGKAINGFLYGFTVISFVFGLILTLVFEQVRAGAFFALLLPLLLAAVDELLAKGLLVWHRKHAGSDCCEFAPAVRYKGRDGNEFFWEFRNREFASAFCEINTPQKVEGNEATAAPETASSDVTKENASTNNSLWQRVSRRRPQKTPLL
jgi:hypothetical protein